MFKTIGVFYKKACEWQRATRLHVNYIMCAIKTKNK